MKTAPNGRGRSGDGKRGADAYFFFAVALAFSFLRFR